MCRPADEATAGGPPAGASTLVRLTSSRCRISEGETLVLVAQVRTLGSSAPLATGKVEFRDGQVLLGRAPLDGTGQARLSGVRLAAGVRAVTAVYSGDDAHAAAASTPLPQAVTATGMAVVLLVAAPVVRPEGTVLEAELVDPRTGRLADDATGRLVFSAGTTAVADADLVAGHARALVAPLPPGRVSASYPGDAEHAPATGVALDAPVRP